jgi:hypothetical protein
MLKAFLERLRVKKIFARYVSPEVARQIAHGAFQSAAATTTERSIEVVFIALTAPDAATYSERVSIIAELAAQHGGIVHTLLPVAVIAFGSVCSTLPGSRLAFVGAAQSLLSGAVAIVHGSIYAHVGSFGSAQYLENGFWWPGALDALLELAPLSLGDTHELPIERIA